MPLDVVRDAAIDVLLRVFEQGAFLNVAIDKSLRRKDLSERGRRFLTELAYGTVRQKLLCDFVLAKLLEQPLERLPPSVLAVLRMGVYQALFCSQVTFPAMVHTSVDLAKKRGGTGMSRVANAVLRRAPQSVEDIRFPKRERGPAKYLSLRHSMPQWLVEEWMAEYGEATTEALCIALNQKAPTSLRTNMLKTSPDQLLVALAKAGCAAKKATPVPEEVTIIEGMPPSRSALFREGHFMIQDPAAMLAVPLLDPQAGDLVLDLCAAPGGKSTHMAEFARGEACVIAMDVHPRKTGEIAENAARLESPGLRLLCGDGLRPPLRPGFDRVLVDAPCTGLGTVRRHPELKWRARPGDAREMAARQAALLRSGIELCNNGGLIVYSVCTFSRPETVEVVMDVLNDGRVRLEDGPDWLAKWKINQGQYRTLPHEEGLDGFFLTRFRKVS